MLKLVAIADTWLKLSGEQAKSLPDDKKLYVEQGAEFELNWSRSLTDNEKTKGINEGIYFKIELTDKVKGRYQWYAYKPDVRILGNNPLYPYNSNTVKAMAKPNVYQGKVIKLPTNKSVALGEPILEGGNFTWDEATHGGTRIPRTREIEGNVIAIAKTMEDVRSRLGDKPIFINSWYRTPEINYAVGGSSKSRHMVGDAVDFRVAGIHPKKVYYKLTYWWHDKGGLASSTVFTHIDERGYYARWSYSF